MKINEEYWLNLYNEGKIEIDFDNGIVWSWLNPRNRNGNIVKHRLGNKTSSATKYARSSAGPTRRERYHILLHRLIWICANGDIPEFIEVNHKNGIKNDNRLSNLELVTKSEQALHSRRVLGNKGGVLIGEKSSRSILNWEKVDKIRELWTAGGIMHKELGDMFGVSKYTIIDVLRYKSWNKMEIK